MRLTTVTFVVNYHDPEKMNQPDVTRQFATEYKARIFIEELDRLAPKAKNVHLTRITSTREEIF